MMEKLKAFVKSETVFCIAAVCAVISCFFVPVDAEYLSYIDVKTLVCLFCMMAVVRAIQDTGVLNVVAKTMVLRLKNSRALITGIVFMTFISSIFIANEMALLTFLPLTLVVLHATGEEKKAIFIFVLQNIGANLGGMLTPFGNPQNIYLFNFYNIPTGAFFRIMGPLFLISIVMLFTYCMFMKKEPLSLQMEETPPINTKKLLIYGVLFCLSVLTVFKFINYYVGLAIVFVTLAFMDKDAIRGVDYMLMLTFCAFFVLSGNLARMESVNRFLRQILVGHEMLVAIGTTQVICNVPTAILFSKFTPAYAPLLVAVNIGSFGTLIASLASLITFKTYTRNFPKNGLKYVVYFTLINVSFLLVLAFVAHFFLLKG